MWLALAALVVLADLFIVYSAAMRFGLCPTVVTLMLVGMLGAQLVRSSGIRLIARFQEAIARGEAPEEGVLEGLLLFAAGVAFALPGVLTDVLAFALLVPWVRRKLAYLLRQRLERSMAAGRVRVINVDVRQPSAPFVDARRDPNVIDVEGSDVTELGDDRRLPP
jgi:UPF0716 protein FxsA